MPFRVMLEVRCTQLLHLATSVHMEDDRTTGVIRDKHFAAYGMIAARTSSTPAYNTNRNAAAPQ